MQHGSGGALATARHDGDKSLHEPVHEPHVESAGSDAGQPTPPQQQRANYREQQRRQHRQLAVEPWPGKPGKRWSTREPDGEPPRQPPRPPHGSRPHTEQRGSRDRRERDDLQTGAKLRQPPAGDPFSGGYRGSREESARAQGQGQDPR